MGSISVMAVAATVIAMKNKKKVVIGMSGGVDSSVAAYLLQKEGYTVLGVTLDLFGAKESENQTSQDAQAVCERLGIHHEVLDCRGEFQTYVIDYFVEEYVAGRTPNPCIMCNPNVKFKALFEYADQQECEFVATGHYIRIQEENGRFRLYQANSVKDQSYFLYRLKQDQLKRLLMPLWKYEKEDVRKMAESIGLEVAKKPDSQEICFIPKNDYISFLKDRTKKGFAPGNFVNLEGEVLGRHQGIANFTVGQRKGLGVTFGKPMFVIGINAQDNTVVLGEGDELFSDILFADHLHFIAFEKLKEPIKAEAKIRFGSRPASCRVEPAGDDRIKVVFDQPQRAITAGQSVVFYQGNELIGGGIIL